MLDIFDERNKTMQIVIGYFFVIPLVILLIFIIIIAVRSQVLFNKEKYYAFYKYGNEIRKGTLVTVNGIEAGEVYSVVLARDNRIKVEMILRKQFAENIREDSVAKIVRPLLIGNKQIFITAGSPDRKLIKPGSLIQSEESSELIDLVSGISLNDFIKSMNLENAVTGEGQVSVRTLYNQAVSALIMMGSLQTSLGELSASMSGMNNSFGKMSDSMDALDELTVSMADFSRSMESMQTLAQSLDTMSSSIDKMEKLSASMDLLAEDLASMAEAMDNLSSLSEQMKSMNKSLEGMGEMGALIKKLSSFIDEMEIVVKAMEESLLLKSKVDRVRKKQGTK